MSSQLDQLCNFYSDFSSANLWRLSEIYHADCQFSDPVHEIHGIDAVTEYFGRLSANLVFCQFEFHRVLESDQQAFLSWTMNYAHNRLKQGAPLHINGVTEIAFKDGKVLLHKDYYDLGAMLYEQIPLLGPLVGAVKARVA